MSRGELNVGVASGGHADFSSTESLPEIQRAKIPSKKLPASVPIAQVPRTPAPGSMAPGNGPHRPKTRDRIRASKNGRSDLKLLLGVFRKLSRRHGSG